MSQDCTQLQAQLLDDPNGPLDETARRHLATCPVCREVARDAREIGGLLEQPGRDAPPLLPAELREAVGRRIQARLAAGASPRANAARPPATVHTLARDAAAPRLPKWGALAAAALALVILGWALWHPAASARVGQLDFMSGEFRLRAAAGGERAPGALGPGDRLHTAQDCVGWISLGDDREVRVAVAPDTRLSIIDRTRLELEQGQVWLGVEPGGEGFQVATAQAVVRVTGTRFGVVVAGGATQVDVTEGSVQVASPTGRVARLAAGETLSATAAGELTAPGPRAEGREHPRWVTTAAALEQAHAKARYLPSVGAARE